MDFLTTVFTHYYVEDTNITHEQHSSQDIDRIDVKLTQSQITRYRFTNLLDQLMVIMLEHDLVSYF